MPQVVFVVLRVWSHRTPPAGHYVTGVAMPRAADGESSRYAPMRAASRHTGPTGAPPWTVCSRPRRRRARRRRRRRMRTDSARQSTATTLDAPRQRPQGPLCLRWWRRGGGSTLQQEDIIISFTACRRLTSAVRPAPIDYRDVRLRSQPREKASTTSCAIVLRASSRRTPPAGHHATGVVMPRAADGDSSRYAPMRAAPRRGRTASNPARCSPRWAPRLLF